MARFEIGQPITTREPSIEVDPGLRVGRHRFQLEVVASGGRTSPPDVVEVTVVERLPIPIRRDILDLDTDPDLTVRRRVPTRPIIGE